MANIFDQFDQNMPESAEALPNQIPQQAGSTGGGYADLVESAGAKWGIPAGLMTQLMGKESSGDPTATSSKGAMGLTQVMPGTARDMGYDPAQLAQDPAMQADAGAQYLSRMYQRYGDWGTALQAYHDGPGNVDKQLAGQATPGPEGRQYVDDRFNQWTGRGAGSDGSGEPTQYATSARSPSAGGNVFDQFGDYQAPAAADGAGATGADQQVPAVSAGNALNQAGSDGAQGAAAPNGNGEQGGANQPGQTDPNEEAARNWEKLGQTVLHSLDQGARGVAQTGIDLLNTPISLANMISQAVTDAGKGVGLVDESTQAPTITPGGIPGLAPTDKYAQIGTLIGDMLAPLPGPRKAQAATELLGLVREAPDATSFATRLADMTQNWIAAPAARAVPGAIAAGRGDPEETLTNIALAPAGEAVGRAVIGGAGRLWNALRGGEGAAGGAADAAADATRSTQATEAGISDAVARDASKFRLTPDQTVQGANGETLRASDEMIDLANMADVDKKLMKTARDLGMEDQLTPAAYARDTQFRTTLQQLVSRKSSNLETQQINGISRLGEKADELIDSMTSMNAQTIDQAFAARTRAIIDGLGDEAEKAYNAVSAKIPRNAEVRPDSTVDYLTAKADELGGDEYLSAAEKKALDWMAPKPGKVDPVTGLPDQSVSTIPTYARLDTLRKQVGEALNKKNGPFKDEVPAQLKQLYARLTDDQERVAAQYGAADDWNVGKQLVKRRKDLETQALEVLGKNLDNSITGKVQSAILNLGKKGGSARDWDKLMAATPDSLKSDVVANALERTLGARSARDTFAIPGFVDWYKTAQANGTLGNVMQHLPRQQRQRLMQIYRVANGIDRAKRFTTTTGSISDFVKRFDDPGAGGVMSKLYGAAGWLGKHAAALYTLGPAGNAALAAAQAAGRATRVPRSVLADNVLSGENFNKLLQAAAAQSSGKLTPAGRTFVREAEEAAANSPEWKALIEAMTPEEKAAINRAGIVGFLSGTGGQAAASDQQQQ
ncbi:transglycosylase [Enterobacteria phage IME_EC2]|uniref:Transglycosylase n=1 Tax=Enterobacteria phage IME_EC2 TaxID=1414766 RepID=A0A0A0P1R1_9CAUD|nr:DNA transfer protein [Enterobacteria phage IME_EC2]AGZ17817.1 transglycosylase [Enterobacteria phage IME_EC2]